jgi:hypothetical protein
MALLSSTVTETENLVIQSFFEKVIERCNSWQDKNDRNPPRAHLHGSPTPYRFNHPHLAYPAIEGERWDEGLIARVHVHPSISGSPKWTPFFTLILGCFLRSRFVSPLWIRQILKSVEAHCSTTRAFPRNLRMK